MPDHTPERRETAFQRKAFELVRACFDECQGMTLHSAQESDSYWELAERLIAEFGKAIGEAPLRKVDP